ncbi:hypothetical protein [Kitasatospora sp. NPDC091276]
MSFFVGAALVFLLAPAIVIVALGAIATLKTPHPGDDRDEQH